MPPSVPIPIDVGLVIAAAQRVATRHPDRVNPVLPGTRFCAYTSPTDPDHHCLAGSVLLELGMRLPPEETAVFMSPDYHLLTDQAQDLLHRLQNAADERGDGELIDGYGPPYRTFGEVVSEVVEDYHERGDR